MLDMPAPATVIGGWAESPSSLRLPVGPYANGKMEMREATGAVGQRAYRMDDQRLTTLQLLSPLLDQVKAAGYRMLYQCETNACGGFDFRYGMDVLPEPQMHVDLGDFRYVLAERPTPRGPDLIALLVSRSADQGFVQVTTVAANPAEVQVIVPPKAETAAPPPPTQPPQADFGQTLLGQGSVALEDLIFDSGSAVLADKDYPSLTALAGWLAANPGRHVTLVGHTDASGSLAANVSLSKQRAQSVRAALIAKYGADGAMIDAQGAGYLAPRASNETPEGRTKNRRVEVMLTPTL